MLMLSLKYDLASSSDSDLEGNASNAALENLDEVIQGVIEPLSKLNVNEGIHGTFIGKPQHLFHVYSLPFLLCRSSSNEFC